MFRITCFVTDKHLADVLRALGQRVMNLDVQPVVGAEVNSGVKGRKEKRAKPKGDGLNNLERFINELHKVPTIHKASAQEALRLTGSNPSSVNYFLGQAQQHGFLKKHGKGTGTTYTLLQKPTKGEK